MPRDGAQPDNHRLSADAARELIRTAGLRCTSCRVAVLQHLAAETAPVSHADVSDILVPQGYDKSTIYRCLIELADAGLAARLELGDHVWRFEMRNDQRRHGSEHPHFMCVDCGKVSCLTDVQVQIRPKTVGDPAVGDVTEVLLKGRCGECQ